MPREAKLQIALILFLTIALGVYFLHLLPTTVIYWSLVGSSVVGALPVLWRAVAGAREQDWASMDMLASVALIFSLLSASWASAVFIELMLAAANLLSVLTEARTSRSIESLLKLRPETARVRHGEKIETVAIGSVQVGDEVVIDAGTRVAVDGTVISGEGAVDQSTLTGESLPIDATTGSKVFASTLLVSGTIIIRAEKVGKDTTLERIIKLVEAAQQSQSNIATVGQKFGKVYLIGMFVVACGLFVITQNLSFVLAVVLVVCADDIAVAIPLAYMGAIGTAAKRGVVIKGGAYLEVLGRVQTFVFDKTGTLTTGKLTVADIITQGGMSQNELLVLGAAANRGSNHPLARAIVAHAEVQGLTIPQATSAHTVNAKGAIAQVGGTTLTTGRANFLADEGITIPAELSAQAHMYTQQGKSISFVAKETTAVGFITLSDTIKPEAKSALAQLRTLGAARLIMLTGDNESVASLLGRELGLDAWKSGLLPEDKIAVIEVYKKEGEVVMVGDGVNDAAALASATVGIAMGAIGYDTAIESADIVLMRDNLADIPALTLLARRAHTIALQDFFIWGATNTLGLILVFTGVIGPAGAAAYNFISDFFPLINSIRTRSGPVARRATF